MVGLGAFRSFSSLCYSPNLLVILFVFSSLFIWSPSLPSFVPLNLTFTPSFPRYHFPLSFTNPSIGSSTFPSPLPSLFPSNPSLSLPHSPYLCLLIPLPLRDPPRPPARPPSSPRLGSGLAAVAPQGGASGEESVVRAPSGTLKSTSLI